MEGDVARVEWYPDYYRLSHIWRVSCDRIRVGYDHEIPHEALANHGCGDARMLDDGMRHIAAIWIGAYEMAAASNCSSEFARMVLEPFNTVMTQGLRRFIGRGTMPDMRTVYRWRDHRPALRAAPSVHRSDLAIDVAALETLTPSQWQAELMADWRSVNVVAREPQRQRNLEQDRAKDKAEQLLLRMLNDEQKRQYRNGRSFTVLAPGFGEFRISYGRSFNVTHLAGQYDYCAVPANVVELPTPDIMLTQKIALETNPQEFLRIANKKVKGRM